MSQDTTDWTGRVVRVRIEGPAHGGEFVARHEGRVVFCRGGITGELVDAVVDDDPGRAFCRATVRSVVEPSPHRTEPGCPAAAAGAGCCDWSHIAPEAARGFTGRILAEQAERIGRIALPVGAAPVPVDVPAGDDATTGWRTVARWVTGADGVPGVRRARSTELVTAPCSQPDPRLGAAVAAASIGPHREVLGVIDDDDEVHISSRPAVDGSSRGRGRRDRRSAATRARARRSRAAEWELVSGAPAIVRRVGGHEWRLPPDGFWQAHRSAATHYSAVVAEAVARSVPAGAGAAVWDLYGGAGLFAAAVLDAVPAADVLVVESSAASLDAVGPALGGPDGAASVGGPHPGSVRTVRSRVESFLAGDDRPTRHPDPRVVVLDPPRGGAGIPVMQRLAESSASRIVHVGCDPASLARDVGVLVAAGWTLVELRGVAAFPGTHHVEGIAVLNAPTRG